MKVVGVEALVFLAKFFKFGAVSLEKTCGLGICRFFVYDIGAVVQTTHGSVGANQFQQQGAGIRQVWLPFVAFGFIGIKADMDGRVVLRQIGSGNTTQKHALVFLHQHQIIAVKIYFFQWQQLVERLVDGLATAQHEQIFA